MSEVRIIGGQWKRSKLPVADRPGLRPTPDRVRETLFNWLGQDLSGWRVLDAFAGSGALGFEAASRGAEKVLLLERDPALAKSLKASAVRLKAENLGIECTDALAWMRRATPGQFEMVMLDPPFGQDLFEPALQAAAPLLADGGLIYLEAPELLEPPTGFERWKSGRAGAVHFQLFARQAATA
ncbi:16S rRNA (guanine(966)-N(2))-methyltransferase RsmD [Pelomonas sp. KK5]|uniref:16S rRNA (guanine(966)-N(2))-methyltransferase RsmD n=1 Tax=Pelomonas sp. KK5 TaxID=1855730 RepID=UPI00097C3473|nr:16S rRNA (guanine(966)-N(2))-methyltransferase RsmD [Pelomonas sp. KK5]